MSFVDARVGRSHLAAAKWNCIKCSLTNKPVSRKCEACGADKPPAATLLTLSVTVPGHAAYAHTPLLLDKQKAALSLGFLRDQLESATGVPDAKQMLLWRDALVEGDAAARVVDLLPGCNPADVITLTLHHADRVDENDAAGVAIAVAAAAAASAASKLPQGSPTFGRKKSSRSGGLSRQSSTESGGGGLSRQGSRFKPRSSPQPPAAGAAAGDDMWDANGDEAGDDGWGDEEGDWGGEEEEEGFGADEDEAMPSPRKLPAAVTPASAAAAAAAAASSSYSAAASAVPSSAHPLLSCEAGLVPFEGWVSKTAHYVLRAPSQLEQHVYAKLVDLAEVLGLTPDEASIVCRNFKDRWNRDKIEQAWMEDSEKVRRDTGLGPEPSANHGPDPAALVECGTCGDEVPAKETFALTCDDTHRFCNTCWSNWVVAEFDKGPTCINTKCQGYKCTTVVPSAAQARFLADAAKAEKLSAWLLEDFVSSGSNQRNYKNCPHPGCIVNAGRVEGVEHVGGVDCACKGSFCFECMLEDHRPASCADAKKWTDKNSSDAMNVSWVIANTKDCPKCKVHIEKNQGCNHMTCRKCSHQFCWLCKADWNGHSSCANFSASPASPENVKVADAQNELKKYMHYWSRFDNHAKSIKFAQKTRAAAEERMAQLQAIKGTGLLDVQFLVDASDTVIRNKRILQWLYVYGYFFDAPEGSSDRALFELHQATLEKFTDELHGLTEQSMEELMKPEMRVRMLSFCQTVAKFRGHLIEAVEASNKLRASKEEEARANAAPAAASSSSSSSSSSTASKKVSKTKSSK